MVSYDWIGFVEIVLNSGVLMISVELEVVMDVLNWVFFEFCGLVE